MKRLLAAAFGAALFGALPGALCGCSLGGGTQHVAAARSASVSASASAVKTYDPMAGPVESASQLPKSCSAILGDADLEKAFGAPQTGDTSYGSYAPLPKIGRTGRVTCGYGIGIDESGNATAASVTVSLITYDTAGNAVRRVASNVGDAVAKGATQQAALVGGHPATIVTEPQSPSGVGTGTGAATGGGSASGTASAQASGSASASPSAVAGSAGETELLMADGNRTFVLEIPLAKLSGTGAANVLINIAEMVYRHATPGAGA